MIVSKEQKTDVEVMLPEIMWRNPLSLVQAHLIARETSNPDYRWAEQARKIRTRRANWNVNHHWAA